MRAIASEIGIRDGSSSPKECSLILSGVLADTDLKGIPLRSLNLKEFLKSPLRGKNSFSLMEQTTNWKSAEHYSFLFCSETQEEHVHLGQRTSSY